MKIIDKNLNYGRHHIESFICNLGSENSNLVFVDLGAGQGDDLMIAKKYYSLAEFIACESYEPYQETLKKKGIKVFSCDIEHDKLPFENESVDVIICNQIFEHCKEIWWMLHEISRVLKIGGKLIIGVPNLASMHNRLLLFLGEQPSTIQNQTAHVRGYTKKDFIKVLNSGFKDGYKLEMYGGGNFYPFPPFIAKPLASLLPNMAWAIFFRFQKIKAYSNTFIEFPKVNRLETNFFLNEIK